MGKCFLIKNGSALDTLSAETIEVLEEKGIVVKEDEAKISNLPNLLSQLKKPEVQIKVGTVKTGTNGPTETNIGFRPDIIQFSLGQKYTYSNTTYIFSSAMDFTNHYVSTNSKITDFSKTKVICNVMPTNDSYYYLCTEGYPTESGFGIEVLCYNEDDYDYTTPISKTLTYTAIKYTE